MAISLKAKATCLRYGLMDIPCHWNPRMVEI
jgi:hypothetical protein